MFAWLRSLMFDIEATSICLVEATNVFFLVEAADICLTEATAVCY